MHQVFLSVSAFTDLVQWGHQVTLVQSTFLPQCLMIFPVYFCLKHVMDDVMIFIDLVNIRILQDIHIVILTV